MNRLTRLCENTENGKYAKHTYGEYIGLYPDSKVSQICEKLAAYEEKGIEPEDMPSALDMANIFCALQKLKAYEKFKLSPDDFSVILDKYVKYRAEHERLEKNER